VTGHATANSSGGQASDQANEVGQAGAGDPSDESGPRHATRYSAAAKSAESHDRSPTPNLQHPHPEMPQQHSQICRRPRGRFARAATRAQCVAPERPEFPLGWALSTSDALVIGVLCATMRVVGPFERAVRRALNPISTRVTMLVQGVGTRRALRAVPRGSATAPRPGQRPSVVSATPRPGQRPSRGLAEPSSVPGEVVLPDLVGLTIDEAQSLLCGIGLVPVGPDPDAAPLTPPGWRDGVVVDQRPYPGTRLAIGSPVMMWIERGPGSAGVREPRRPTPSPPTASGMVDEETGDASADPRSRKPRFAEGDHQPNLECDRICRGAYRSDLRRCVPH
jgi:hypothetical protein